jgi:hypothetical protein
MAASTARFRVKFPAHICDFNFEDKTMRRSSNTSLSIRCAFLFVMISLVACVISLPALAQSDPAAKSGLAKISVDKFTNSDSTHKTEVEPSSYAWESTIVSAYHVARRPNSEGWGSADVGFSTSTDGGKTWKYGYLPGLTVNYEGGSYGAASDPAVAYDAKHGEWLIATLPLVGLNPDSQYIGDVAVSRSSDGLHWGNPIVIDSTHLDDKSWIVCDNTASSPYYGNCYTEWDQAYGTGDVLMSTSSDGGQTWGAGLASADHATGLGGEPVVQPNGTVVVPFEGFGVAAFTSTNGGKSWNKSVAIANISEHGVAGGFRDTDLPSATIDGAGNVYVVWTDCRFRTGCTSNDIVMSTSTDGQKWTAVARIPIDAVTSTVDHFMSGIGADPATSGSTAHLALVYYYYPVANCSSCQLYAGYTASQDGGQTWTAGAQLAGPMKLTWLPYTDLGYMVADYIAVSFSGGNAFGIFPVAKGPSKTLLNEAIYTNKTPLPLVAGAQTFSSRNEKPVPNAKSDYERKVYLDDEGRVPLDESRRPKRDQQ